MSRREDGWIDWAGGDRSPVADNVSFDYRRRDGKFGNSADWKFIEWTHWGYDSDIVAYRPAP